MHDMKARRCEYRKCKKRYEPNHPKQHYCKPYCRVMEWRAKQKEKRAMSTGDSQQ